MNRKRRNSPKFEKEGGVKEEKAMGTGCGEKGEVEREKERGEGGGKHRRRCCWDLPHLSKPSSDLHFLFFFPYAFDLSLLSIPLFIPLYRRLICSVLMHLYLPLSLVFCVVRWASHRHPPSRTRQSPNLRLILSLTFDLSKAGYRLVSCAKALSTVVTQSKPWSRPPGGCAHHSLMLTTWPVNCII